MPLSHLVLPLLLFGGPDAPAVKQAADWQAVGTLLECCTCAVPCTCNFGQGPSPHDYCHTIYAYKLKTGRYEGVKLDGLIFGGGEGPEGATGFLDSRATPAQRAALKQLALAVFAQGGASAGERPFVTTRITAEEGGRKFRIAFAGHGGFTADTLIGADGKNPIIVENNTTWPVHRFAKGKTTAFDYKDARGNNLRDTGTNANVGAFNLSGKKAFARSAQARLAQKGCCATKPTVKRRAR